MEKKEFLLALQEKLENAEISADIDVDINFFNEDGTILDRPHIVVKYYPTDSDVRQRIIPLSYDIYTKTIQDAFNYITFQIEQFAEEIDSIEFSGE